MKHILKFALLAFAALTLSACDTLNDLIQTPAADYSGTYADLNVNFGQVCGLPRKGEVQIKIDTKVVEDVSVHTITATAVIYDAGQGGQTLTSSAQWSVNGSAKNLNSGAIDDFGSVVLSKDGYTFKGNMTIYNVECLTPSTDPSQPDTTTYGRVVASFEAK